MFKSSESRSFWGLRPLDPPGLCTGTTGGLRTARRSPSILSMCFILCLARSYPIDWGKKKNATQSEAFIKADIHFMECKLWLIKPLSTTLNKRLYFYYLLNLRNRTSFYKIHALDMKALSKFWRFRFRMKARKVDKG